MAAVPTRTKRAAHGSLTLNAAASAIANTVPGSAHGAATSVSSAVPSPPRRRTDPYAAANPSRSAPAVAATAIQSEFTIGRRRSGVATSAA